MPWYLLVLLMRYFLVELVHIAGRKRQFEGEHLVETAAERPHVRLLAVLLVVPHFRTGVAGCARLRLIHFILEHLADIHVS